ncbi:MAG: tellurite resistance TerB family protein [Pseudomonadota bacterium]
MLKWLQDNARSAREKLAAEVSKFKNKDFMEAVVAGCALVASADGEISSAEKQKLIGFIQNSDELKAFDLDQVIGSFNNICSKMEFDQQIGRAEALKKIGLIRSNVEASRLMVRVCCAIGASDGQFDANERAVVRTIAQELGLNPADFDL